MISFKSKYDKILDIIINILLLALCIIVFLNVILRTIFTSLTWTIEVSRILVVYFVFLGSYVAFEEKSHVNVDLFTSRLPQKWKNVCNVINNILIFCCLLVLVLGSYQLMMINKDTTFLVTGISYAFLYGIEFLVVIAMVLSMVKDLVNYFKNKSKAYDNTI